VRRKSLIGGTVGLFSARAEPLLTGHGRQHPEWTALHFAATELLLACHCSEFAAGV
jgi:hypothetical protein